MTYAVIDLLDGDYCVIEVMARGPTRLIGVDVDDEGIISASAGSVLLEVAVEADALDLMGRLRKAFRAAEADPEAERLQEAYEERVEQARKALVAGVLASASQGGGS